MSEKLPYYMAYPMPFAFDDGREDRRDYEYMLSVYPMAAKQIVPYVQEACDDIDHRFSMMYDEYPDCLQLRRIAAEICKRIKEDNLPLIKKDEKEIRDLVEVLLCQEMRHRRQETRREERKLYPVRSRATGGIYGI